MNVLFWTNLLNFLFFVYAFSLFGMYTMIGLLSVFELRRYRDKNINVNYKDMLSFYRLPSVSVIAPAYNEQMTIIENIKCLISLQYPDFEVIIVNDGSKDNTLSTMIEYFNLVKVDRAFELQVPCAPIRGVYKATNPAYSHLFVVDKENGGKADALNAGINIARNDLFLGIDVDSIIEPDAILKMVKPFVDDPDHIVIASGGVIRVANSCEVTDGKISKVKFPRNLWAKFQVLEYFRAFTLGRMAWSRLNGLLIISGAFGLFDRKRVIKIGGYDKTTVGEDLELVVRLRRYMHEVEKKKYRVAFIPDPLCWTEVPENLRILSRQRNRWTRGAIDTILKHKKMMLNPQYVLIGMLSFPYWVLYEWLAPIIQVVGIVYTVFLLIFGLVNAQVMVLLLLFVLTFALMYSLFAIFFEAFTFHRYRGMGYIIQSIMLVFLEMLFYQPLNMYFALSGNFDYFFRKKKKGWGTMTRTGFSKKKQ
ncbi:MAG: glycosyltransferase family 2 protein [Microbacter sp.]